MSDTAEQFVFDMRYIDWSDDPYYHRDWYGATPIEVVASNKREAMEKARAVLGPAPTHRVWGIKVVSVKDIRIPSEESK